MRRLLVIGLPIVVFCAFMVATAGAAIAPSVQKLTAPFVCTGSYSTLITHSETSSYAPGQSTTQVSAYCADAQHHLKALGTIHIAGVLFAEFFVVGLAVLLIIGLSRLVLRRRPAVQTAMA